METYKEKAINALRGYLIDLLEAGRWCDAKRVGAALESVLNTQQSVNDEQCNQMPPTVMGEMKARVR